METIIESYVNFQDKENLITLCLSNLFEKTTEITFVQPFPNGFTFYINKDLNNTQVKTKYWKLNNVRTKEIDLDSLTKTVIVYGSLTRFKKVLKKEGLEYLIYIPYIENDLNDVIEYCNSKKIPYKLN